MLQAHYQSSPQLWKFNFADALSNDATISFRSRLELSSWQLILAHSTSIEPTTAGSHRDWPEKVVHRSARQTGSIQSFQKGLCATCESCGELTNEAKPDGHSKSATFAQPVASSTTTTLSRPSPRPAQAPATTHYVPLHIHILSQRFLNLVRSLAGTKSASEPSSVNDEACTTSATSPDLTSQDASYYTNDESDNSSSSSSTSDALRRLRRRSRSPKPLGPTTPKQAKAVSTISSSPKRAQRQTQAIDNDRSASSYIVS